MLTREFYMVKSPGFVRQQNTNEATRETCDGTDAMGRYGNSHSNLSSYIPSIIKISVALVVQW